MFVFCFKLTFTPLLLQCDPNEQMNNKIVFVEQVTKLVSCGLDATWMRTNSLNGRVVNFHPAALGLNPCLGT